MMLFRGDVGIDAEIDLDSISLVWLLSMDVNYSLSSGMIEMDHMFIYIWYIVDIVARVLF